MYDVVISINVHENFNFLLRQLENIQENVKSSYAVILNCNEYMYQQCTQHTFPTNIYVHPVILNKATFHGSLTHGIYSNMCYALQHLEFEYFIVTSSRNFFENDLRIEDLHRIVELETKGLEVIKEMPQVYRNKRIDQIYNVWWFQALHRTPLFANHIIKHYNSFYSCPHEGVVFRKKDCLLIQQFFVSQPEIKKELFMEDTLRKDGTLTREGYPVEEIALQTIIKSQKGHYYYIGDGCCNGRNGPNDFETGRLFFMYKTVRN